MDLSSSSAQLEAPKVGPSAPPSYIITHSASKKRNIGRLVRVATAFGVKEVCLVGSRQSSTPDGNTSEAHVTTKYFQNLRQCVQHLKEVEGCRVLGVEICEGALPVQQHPFSGPTAFLLGNEGQGLSAKQMALCDGFVYIPQHGPGNAPLNVASAASIVLHHFAVWAEYPEREAFRSQGAEQSLSTFVRDDVQDSDDSLWQQCKERHEESPKAPSTPSLADSLSSRSSDVSRKPAPSSAMQVWTDAAVLVVAVADYAGLCSLLLPSELAGMFSRMMSAFERAAAAYGAVKIEASSGVMSAAILPVSSCGSGFIEDGTTAGLRLAALYRLGRMLLDVATTLPVPGTTTCLQLQMSISLGNLMGHSPVAAVPPFSPSSTSPPAMLYFGPLLAELLDLARRAPPMTIVAPDGEAAALRASGATADIRGPLFLEADDSSTAGSVGEAPTSASGGGGSLVSRRLWLVEAHPLAYRYLQPQLRYGKAGGDGPAASVDEPYGTSPSSRYSLSGMLASPELHNNDKPDDSSSSTPSRAVSIALGLDLDLDSASVRADSQTSNNSARRKGAQSLGKGSTGGKASSVRSSDSSSCTGTCITFSPSVAVAAAREGANATACGSSGPCTPRLGGPLSASFSNACSYTRGHQPPSLTLTLGPEDSNGASGAIRRGVSLLGRIGRVGSGLGSHDMRPKASTESGDSDLTTAASKQHFDALRTELVMMRQQLQALQINPRAGGAATATASRSVSRSVSRSASPVVQSSGPGPIRRQLGASVLQHLALKGTVPVAEGMIGRAPDRYGNRKAGKSEGPAPGEKPAKKGSKIAQLLFGKK